MKCITERSTYAPLVGYAKSKGFDSISEINWDMDSKTLDLLIQYEDIKYVIEVKIASQKERHKTMVNGVIQAWSYARNENCSNVAVIVYDQEFKEQEIQDDKDVDKISLESSVDLLILSEYWWDQKKITGRDFFDALWCKINEKAEVEKNVDLAAKLLSKQVKELSMKLRNYFLT